MPPTVSITRTEGRHHPAEEGPEPGQDGVLHPPKSTRNHLPDERRSITHKFSVGTHEGYLVVGLYPDGQPGEIFVTMAKEGSTVSGLINSLAQAVSIGLQYGIPLQMFCNKFCYTRFEPSGFTGNPAIPQATSVMDYIFRWLSKKFSCEDESMNHEHDLFSASRTLSTEAALLPVHQLGGPSDAPLCRTCGSLMVRNGSCHACRVCGWTGGCG